VERLVFNATPGDVLPSDDRLPLLFYCHDAVRTGSARRAALVASLSSHFRVVLVGGPKALERVETPPAVEVVRLPSLGSADAARSRADVLLGAYLEIDPAVLLIEQFPFGCAQSSDDLVSVLEGAAANPRTRLVACSVVDFLVDQPFSARRPDAEEQRLANRYFDVVFVHADPRVGRFEDVFERPPLRVPVRYTGFVPPVTDAQVPMARQRYEIVMTCDSARIDPWLFRAAQRPPPPYFELNRSGAAETLRVVRRLADPATLRATA
jgi:predicted glycosyltransferase